MVPAPRFEPGVAGFEPNPLSIPSGFAVPREGRVRRGETLVGLFGSWGLEFSEAHRAARSLAVTFSALRVDGVVMTFPPFIIAIGEA